MFMEMDGPVWKLLHKTTLKRSFLKHEWPEMIHRVCFKQLLRYRIIFNRYNMMKIEERDFDTYT